MGVARRWPRRSTSPAVWTAATDELADEIVSAAAARVPAADPAARDRRGHRAALACPTRSPATSSSRGCARRSPTRCPAGSAARSRSRSRCARRGRPDDRRPATATGESRPVAAPAVARAVEPDRRADHGQPACRTSRCRRRRSHGQPRTRPAGTAGRARPARRSRPARPAAQHDLAPTPQASARSPVATAIPQPAAAAPTSPARRPASAGHARASPTAASSRRRPDRRRRAPATLRADRRSSPLGDQRRAPRPRPARTARPDRRDQRPGRRRHGRGPAAAPTRAPAAGGNRLNPKYMFETFVIGSSNRFAHAASVAVAESPAKAYNPLFIYGGSGLGKTHLLHAIGHYATTLGNARSVRYVSTEEFTNDFINSPARRQDQRVPAPLPRRRHPADRRHPVPGEPRADAGGVLPHLQHAAQREQADRHHAPTARRSSWPRWRTGCAPGSSGACSPTSSRPTSRPGSRSCRRRRRRSGCTRRRTCWSSSPRGSPTRSASSRAR